VTGALKTKNYKTSALTGTGRYSYKGILQSMADAPINATLQSSVDRPMQGRVISLMAALEITAAPMEGRNKRSESCGFWAAGALHGMRGSKTKNAYHGVFLCSQADLVRTMPFSSLGEISGG
jgi:hypothetical protein